MYASLPAALADSRDCRDKPAEACPYAFPRHGLVELPATELEQAQDLLCTVEGIGDRLSADESDGRAELALDLGDEEASRGHHPAVALGEPFKRGCVVGARAADQDARQGFVGWLDHGD
jgi:hypothetical protein